MIKRVLGASLFLVACNRGDAPEPPDAATKSCPDPAEFVLSIDSFAIGNPQVSDLPVFGTLTASGSGKVSSYDEVFLDAVASEDEEPHRVVVATGVETWTAVIPIAVLLEPNMGPGSVRIRAEAVPAACDAGDAGVTAPHGTSAPFMVDFPPPPADAGIDAGSGS